MPTLIDALRQLLRKDSYRHERAERPRRDPQFVGRSSVEEIEHASSERAGELAGHATERVET